MTNGEDERDPTAGDQVAEAPAGGGSGEGDSAERGGAAESETGTRETARSEADEERLEREFLAAMQEEMRRMSVADYLVSLLVSLSSMAFQRLGLTPDTARDRDFEQSRLAVDAFGSLVDVLATVRPADEVALYRSTLHQMRLAYVSAIDATAGADAGPPVQGDASEEPGADPESPAQADANQAAAEAEGLQHSGEVDDEGDQE